MKNKIIFIIAGITALIFTSCNKDLNTVPTQSIDQSIALNSSDDIKVALVGAYRDFGVADFYGGRTFLDGDLLGDFSFLNWTGTYQGMTQINNKAIPVDNGFVTNIWLAGYKAINDANNILSVINKVDAADQQRVEGEAKFIRASSYFELVKKFAKAWNDGDPNTNAGVPLVLNPTKQIDAGSNVKRNSVAEVYKQVIQDLNDAVAKLPGTNGFFASQDAAYAMLARVYLQQLDFANALQAANNAITIKESNGGGLMPNYLDAFGATNTNEDIFAIQVTSSSGTQGFNEFYSSAQRGDIQINQAAIDQFDDPNDQRLLQFYNSGGSTYTSKFDILYGNVHIIRLAEMYLVRAECNFRLGSAVGATPLNDINKIRMRANATPFTILTLNNILDERKRELMFEGFTLDDIKRTQGSVGLLPWNSPKLVFPIPKRERQVNPNLSQNDGY